MLCIKCGTSVGCKGQLCEHCRQIEMARKEEELYQQRYVRSAEQSRKSAILALKIFGAIVVLALLLAMVLVPRGIPNVPLPTLAGHSRSLCEQKLNCAVVYVAPWCPHCHSAIGRIQALKAEMTNHPNIGF